MNCIGGFVGSNNYGVNIGGGIVTAGTGLTQFINATGGGNGAGTNNHGLNLAGGVTYNAPDVVVEATGGFGFGNSVTTGNYGVYVGPTQF